MTVTTDHIGLSVDDIELVSEFYRGVFEMTSAGTRTLADDVSKASMLIGAGGVCLELARIPGSVARSHTSVAGGARTQGWFHWALPVDDLDERLSAVTAHGDHIITRPVCAQTRPGVTFAYVTDPRAISLS